MRILSFIIAMLASGACTIAYSQDASYDQPAVSGRLADIGGAPPSFSVPVRIIEQPDTETDSDRERQAQQDLLDTENLEIQRQVISLGQRTYNLSVAQLVLSALGALGLLVTILLTRKSTKVASEAVSLTKQMMQHQLRAYVLVETTQIKFDTDGSARVLILFRNGGQTPALNVHIGCEMKADEVGSPTPLRPVVFDQTMSKFSVLPDGMRQKIVGPITHEQAKALYLGETVMDVWGEVRYDDIFGEQHFSRFHLTGGGGHGFGDDEALIVHSQGNEEGSFAPAST